MSGDWCVFNFLRRSARDRCVDVAFQPRSQGFSLGEGDGRGKSPGTEVGGLFASKNLRLIFGEELFLEVYFCKFCKFSTIKMICILGNLQGL